MRINPFWMPIILIAALFGTIFTAQAMGQWSISGRESVDLTTLAPADIKGWMTLQQVIDGLGISQKDLYEIGGLPADTAPTQALKDLETVVSVTTLRDRLTAKLGSTSSITTSAEPAKVAPPAAATPATPLSSSAPALVATPSAEKTAPHVTPTPLPAGQILSADQIKGKMTLKEVSDQCAVPLDQLLAGLKFASNTDPNTAIKDLIAQGKIAEVTDVQKVVAALQGK